MTTYYLIPNNQNQDLGLILKKISDYLTSFTGDITVKFVNKDLLVINYPDTSYTAECKTETGKIVLNTFEDDSVTINLIKNISSNAGFRVFNSRGYFLPNDSKLLDISSVGIDAKIMNVFKKAKLTPLFQYRDSLIFFCKDKNNRVYLINRHYLEFLLNNPKVKINRKELFTLVSMDIATFIALFDRGLISLIFPKYQNNDTRDINLSGFDISKLPKDVILQVTNFKLDKERQSFIQESTTNKITNKNYLSLKINQDYSYKLDGKKLTKIINISVFYEFN